MLDKNTVIPLYQQIVEYVREKIRSGEYQPGQLLPSESGFCEEFGVSRITVRNAIQLLVDEGLVTKHHGKGSFVTERADRRAQEQYKGFEDVCEENHIPVYSHVQSVRIVPSNPRLSKELLLDSNEQLVCIERVCVAASVRATFEQIYLPAGRYSYILNMNLENQPFRKAILIDRDTNPEDVLAKGYDLSIKLASEQEALHLDAEIGDPLYVVSSTVFLPDGQPFYYTTQAIPGRICSWTYTSMAARMNLHLEG